MAEVTPDQPVSVTSENPANDSTPPPEKKKKKSKKNSEGEQREEEKRPSEKEKKAESVSEAEPESNPPPRKKKSLKKEKKKDASEGEAPPVKKKKSAKRPPKQPSDKEAEIAFEDPPPEPEEEKKSVSIKSEKSGKSKKGKKKSKKSKKKKKTKKEQPASSDPMASDGEKATQPEVSKEATAVNLTEEILQQQEKKKAEDETQSKKRNAAEEKKKEKTKEKTVSKDETIYNDENGAQKKRTAEDYDASETVKKCSRETTKESAEKIPRIPDPVESTESKKQKQKIVEETRETPTPLTDVTQDHKHKDLMDEGNLTERLKLNAAKKVKTPVEVPMSPMTDPNTPTPGAKQEDKNKKKGASTESVEKGGKASSVEMKVEQKLLCEEHSRQKTKGREMTDQEKAKLRRVKTLRRLHRPKKGCYLWWDCRHVWSCCAKIVIVAYWGVGGMAMAAVLFCFYGTETLGGLE